jgi:4-methyl-5(b-hydroxyethyl)-thiazole monophosphate biosynthesis
LNGFADRYLTVRTRYRGFQKRCKGSTFFSYLQIFMRKNFLLRFPLTITGKGLTLQKIRIIVKADSLFENTDFSEVKMLVLPGGMPGTIHLKEHKGLEELILKHNEEKKYLAAICAAPTVFGGMGILKGKKAICYPGMEEGLTGAEVTCQPAVTDGHITTSRGLGTAIDFALALISELRDKESADTISKQVVYER